MARLRQKGPGATKLVRDDDLVPLPIMPWGTVHNLSPTEATAARGGGDDEIGDKGVLTGWIVRRLEWDPREDRGEPNHATLDFSHQDLARAPSAVGEHLREVRGGDFRTRWQPWVHASLELLELVDQAADVGSVRLPEFANQRRTRRVLGPRSSDVVL